MQDVRISGCWALRGSVRLGKSVAEVLLRYRDARIRLERGEDPARHSSIESAIENNPALQHCESKPADHLQAIFSSNIILDACRSIQRIGGQDRYIELFTYKLRVAHKWK